jgi:hypothetical protein
MGNRAIVFFHDRDGKIGPRVYLHWHGDPVSINGFLAEMDRRGIRGSDDLEYCTARFIHIVCDWFDMDVASGTGIGVGSGPPTVDQLDFASLCRGLDNGVYLVERSVGKTGAATTKLQRVVAGKRLTDEEAAAELVESGLPDDSPSDSAMNAYFTKLRPETMRL